VLPATTLFRILCNAELIPIVLDGNTLPLHLGRRRRLFTPAQHTALAARDDGCAFPGCERPPRFCEAHHNREWDRDNGPTDVDNGCMLCNYHHALVHREGWIARIAANGFPEFIPPRAYDPDRRPRQHHRYRMKSRSA
jgi:hypothetical protein